VSFCRPDAFQVWEFVCQSGGLVDQYGQVLRADPVLLTLKQEIYQGDVLVALLTVNAGGGMVNHLFPFKRS
jgi:hypothetical protein